MNFLAHIYLSGDDQDLKIGNFIADFVKGKAMNDYSLPIQRGIKLHRSIDQFTDSHPIVSQSKKRLWGKYRHFSGVIVDIYYDHFLASNWDQFSNISLETYVNDFYKMIASNEDSLPDRVNHMMPYMMEKNWLLNYANFTGIENVMHGMSRRTKHDSKMEESVEELKSHYEEFRKEFLEFFPELEAHAEAYIIDNGD
jgi:acyl carrier protein phosphodiesterase